MDIRDKIGSSIDLSVWNEVYYPIWDIATTSVRILVYNEIQKSVVGDPFTFVVVGQDINTHLKNFKFKN